MIVILPWPPKELSPNARVHWAKKAKAAKPYKKAGFVLACAAYPALGLGIYTGPVVSITFNPPDRRARDLDNMLASIKSGLDGIAAAIGIDDSKWALKIRKGEVVKGGLVTVEVTA